jgi:glycerol-1-phosphate dehydrogenase [NAD(P)+]
MDQERIQAALRDASDTRSVVIEAGALALTDRVFAQSFGDQAAVVIADDNTFAAAGNVVYERLSLANANTPQPIVFPAAPMLYAEYTRVLELEATLRNYDAIPVVVGSGTLNDLTKLAAHRCGRSYMVVATAASMDGYTAFGAAITRDGFKQTMACPAPRAVLADLDVLAQAPPAMNAAGYGDLLGKVTAGADWLLADALEIEPIDKRAWSLVQDSLRAWLAEPSRIPVGDPQAVAGLFEGLTLTGIAMQLSQSSRVASGSEHRLSHLWEMQALGSHAATVPHGFKVGIGSIATAALYERLLERDLTRLDIDALCRTWPTRAEVEHAVRKMHTIPQLAESAIAESRAKYIDADQLRQRLTLLRDRWPALRVRLHQQLLPASELRDLLHAAGCPTDPTDIGIDTNHLKESYAQARTIRSRYTALDLVEETGLLDACVGVLFGPGGFWA